VQTNSSAGTIVVGLDGSRSSELALVWAIEQARLEHRDLTLVHAGAHEDPETGPALLARAREVVAQKGPGLTVHERLETGDPRELLVAVATGASMLVTGSRGRGLVHSALMGSVGLAVARHAPCPTVVLRPANPGLVRDGILVGIDGTEHSRAPLEFAYRQASLRGLPLTVLHATPAPVPVSSVPYVTPGDAETPDDARLLLAEATSGMGEKYPDVNVRTRVTGGPARGALVRIGRRMNMLVVGSHQGPAAADVVPGGTVPTSVLGHADCAVAVVPSGT
jgi:nucleotide-binding universal stress UspA family protein